MDRSETELRTESDLRHALQELSPQQQLSEAFLDSFIAGTPTDDGTAARLLMSLILKYRVPPEIFVKYRGAFKQSFSNLTWEDVRTVWPEYETVHNIPHMEMDVPYVSRAFVNRVFERMRDVEMTNKALWEVQKEAELVHWFGAVTTEVARHFLGALRNEPGKAMRGELSHGQVEFVWVAFKICVVVVMEMKRKGYATENYARLMGELEAVAFTNVTNQTPTELVRGLMANKDGWIFMNYNPTNNTFTMSSTLHVDAHNRTQMLENRTTGVRLMWQMMLHGYTTAVTSMQRRSKATLGKITAELEAMSNYVPAQKSAEGSSSTKRRRVEPESLKKAFGDRKVSTSKWDRVAALAFQAKTIAESTDSDEGFDEAMSLLHQSIKSLPEYYVKPFDVHELWLEAEATIPDMLKKKTFS